MENYLDCQLPIAKECDIEIDKEPLHVFRNNTSEEIPDKLAIYNATDGNYLSTVSKNPFGQAWLGNHGKIGKYSM